MEQPYLLVRDIIDLRSYAWAKEIIDRAKKQDDIPEHPMVDMVMDIQAEIIREKRASLE